MELERKDRIDLIFAELRSARDTSTSKVNLAWRELILSLAVPVSAGAVDLANVDFLNTRFVMLAACLIGAAIMAYAFYLYFEVACLNKYVRDLETRLNSIVGTEISSWESRYTPWSKGEIGVPVVFSCFLLSMLVVVCLSVIHATTGWFLDSSKEQPLLGWVIVGPCILAFISLAVAIVRFVYGILEIAAEPRP